MYAVIETAGKQYRVELGTELEIDRMDAQPGETIQLERVLLIADGDATHIGRPTVPGATVAVDVVRQARGEKIIVFKYRPKARHRAKRGHRQDLTVLRVSDIAWGDRSAAADARGRQDAEVVAADAASREAERRAAADRALADKLSRDARAVGAAEAAGATGDATVASPSAPAGDPDVMPTKTPDRTSAAGAATTKLTGRAPSSRTQAPIPEKDVSPRTPKKDE